MTPIEKQILRNQKIIMESLWHISSFDLVEYRLIDSIKETKEILNEENSEEDCCEMPEREGEKKE